MSEQFLPSDAMNDRQATGNTQDKKSAVVAVCRIYVSIFTASYRFTWC